MKREGVRPTVVTYSALISAAEKGQQWKLALEVLDEMKSNFGVNVIAYSAAISALSKGQMWHKALELFREIESSSGEKPSIVTYNATMCVLLNAPMTYYLILESLCLFLICFVFLCFNRAPSPRRSHTHTNTHIIPVKDCS